MAWRSFGKILTVLALLWAMSGSTEAATIYTYAFTQDFTYGPADGPQTLPGKLTGGFTGTADVGGYITLNTLSDFHVTFDDPGGTHGPAYGTFAGQPIFFSFLVGDVSGSTLAFFSALDSDFTLFGSTACVGVAVGILCSGGSSRGVVRDPAFVYARSETAPVLTLVSTSSTVATTPIPGALVLFMTALGGVGTLGVWRRKIRA